MFLDVEGYELEVLKGIDFTKTTIEELEVEVHAKSIQHYLDNISEKEAILYYMKSQNYICSEEKNDNSMNAKLVFKPA
jgi:hypothetical protein